MQVMHSVYEHVRDNHRYPTCWQSINNTYFAHFHTSLELVYITSGTMDATVSGVHTQVSAGELLVVPSYAVHRYETCDHSDTLVLIIPLDYISRMRGMRSDHTFESCALKTCTQVQEIAGCMQVLSDRELTADSPVVRGYIQVISGLLLELIPLVETPAGRDAGQIQEILSYLHDNFRSPVGLSALSSRFGYSPSRFSHIFNENVGCSISQYINTLRCRNTAGLLLEHEGISVLDAALASGFESMRTFYRAFRQCFGVTPSQYVELSAKKAKDTTNASGHYEKNRNDAFNCCRM